MLPLAFCMGYSLHLKPLRILHCLMNCLPMKPKSQVAPSRKLDSTVTPGCFPDTWYLCFNICQVCLFSCILLYDTSLYYRHSTVHPAAHRVFTSTMWLNKYTLKLNFEYMIGGFHQVCFIMFPNAHIISLNIKSLKTSLGGVSEILQWLWGMQWLWPAVARSKWQISYH